MEFNLTANIANISKLITSLIGKRKYEEAIELALENIEHELIQSELMSIYVVRNNIIEATELSEKYPNNIYIQRQYVGLLRKNSLFDQAIAICNFYSDDAEIQAQLASIYIQDKKLEQAERICDRFKDNNILQCLKLKILLIRKEYEEAAVLAKKNKDDECFKSLVENYSKLLSYYDEDFKEIYNKVIKRKELSNKIRAKIRYNILEISDINYVKDQNELFDLQQYSLLLAVMNSYLNLNNSALEMMKNVTNMPKKQKRVLKESISSNNKIFDLKLWDQVIDWKEKDYKREELIFETKKEEIIKREIKEIKEIPKKIEKKTKKENIIFSTIKKNNNKKNSNKKIIKERTFTKEEQEAIFNIKLSLYSKMNNEALKENSIMVYDKFEEAIAAGFDNKNQLKIYTLILKEFGYEEIVRNLYPEMINKKTKVLTKKG